jgi:hypothetical protein
VSAAKRRKRIRKESSPSKLEEGQPYVAGMCPVLGAVRWWYEIEPL